MTPSVPPEAVFGIVLIGGCLIYAAWQFVAGVIECRRTRT
jgi:hypothetical protein